ncbi:putative transcription factor C2H2 family [Helianthus annuus]|uniref:Putative RING/U-box superfamily protein n=1 Tax=Helianthus annuus TaxID=4232 RepID=A0A251UBN5_HELAN|nr:RING-H2 finger protein ATL70 [Helianthus annuus]KAF5799420.1 putative transcription factor C2H2 family [Helianthus annuus]KAJ0550867.1 putative transcription factor C2H2 family [Helianthus annuus]KAJ0557735.1 putative transcription factor C2H2 family [Helianthus annuus]KAJ0563833.1 putative transcription factor C2H2 family [Helianthus annuus]KAJ0729170.1 putative transcription factor C2H2 family [Helianthus annuus]
MNNTMGPDPNSGGFLGSQNISGFGYGIGISVGMLLLITTITLASYFCNRTTSTPSPSAAQIRAQRNSLAQALGQPDSNHCVVEVGLDDETLLSYPTMLYKDAKINKSDSGFSTCCSICLGDYKGSDMLRQLPDCGHLFHVKCVDPWLRLNPTCPNCRTSPMPTPLSTPLAEVVPLARRRD